MRSVFREPFSALLMVLKEWRYRVFVTVVSMLFFGLFVGIQLVTIPGNDIRFQLAIYTSRDYALLVVLAVLLGLLSALQLYTIRQRKKSPELAASGVAGGISGILASVLGTASCASCLAGLFGIFGLGSASVFFVLERQLYFFVGALVLTTLSVYLTSRKITRICPSC